MMMCTAMTYLAQASQDLSQEKSKCLSSLFLLLLLVLVLLLVIPGGGNNHQS